MEEGEQWTMSPKTILLFSVAYMGFVILLHIFGKVTAIKPAGVDIPTDPGADAGATGEDPGAGGAGDL